jgi:hypothetical protein
MRLGSVLLLANFDEDVDFARIILGRLAAHSDFYDIARIHWFVGRNIEPDAGPSVSRRVATVDAGHGQTAILEIRVLQSRCKQMLPLRCELEDLLAGCSLHDLCEPQRSSLILAGRVQF